jgi:hypothetical protein
VTSDAPNPFVYGSPDGSRRGRRAAGAGASGVKQPLERVAKADVSVVKLFLIDLAITAYAGFIAWAIVASGSGADSTTPAEAWAIVGFTVLALVGMLVGFGHFLLQYVGLLGVLYARGAGGGWEFGPRWGFVLRHRARLDRGDGLTVVVSELPPSRRGGRNYGKYRWTLQSSSDEVSFRSPVGLSETVRKQVTAWAEAHAVSVTLEADPPA